MRLTRFRVYGLVTTILTALVVAHVGSQRKFFFTTCIQLTRSNTYLLVLLNFVLFLTIIFGRILQRFFFGHLRALEVEHLYERSWYAITETCLAMTIFRDDFDVKILALFGSLLFSKIFHWLVQDRVDFMEQGARPTLVFHIKMVLIIVSLLLMDVAMVAYSINYIIKRGTSMMVIFGFEYTLLSAMIVASFIKYVLHSTDLSRSHPWENKSMYIFYLDLCVDFIKLLVYFLFFGVIVHHTGSLPLHIIRDLYMTVRSFTQRCRDLIQYRRATSNMDERYPNATLQELSATDRVCIICREEMDVALTGPQPAPAQNRPHPNVPKKLPCAHIFHFHCLKSWLERQQNCPTCRRSVLDAPPIAATPQAPVVNNAPQVDARAQLLQMWQQQLEQYRQQIPPRATVPGLQPTTSQSQTPLNPSLSVNTSLPHASMSNAFPHSSPNFMYPLTLTPLVPVGNVNTILGMIGFLAANMIGVPEVYDQFTDEQLALMEGSYRDAVINRIQAVQHVQNQLTGIVTQLTQVLQLMPAVPDAVSDSSNAGANDNQGNAATSSSL